MIVGVGLDILYLPRLIHLVKRRGYDGLARRILTQEERTAFYATIDATKVEADAGAAAARYLAVR